jgi:glycerol-3-phosphate dehydrogenase
MNLVVPRLPFDAAIGIPAPRRGQELDSVLDKGAVTYFIMPWNEHSLIGTKHLRLRPGSGEQKASASDVEEFLAEINPVLGDLRIAMRDVIAVKQWPVAGEGRAQILPATWCCKSIQASSITNPKMALRGLISIVGVKWTTARLTAEQSVALAMKKLRRTEAPFTRPARLAVEGTTPDASSARVASGVSEGQIRRAVMREWACKLTDVIFRRTGLFLDRQFDGAALARVATLMGQELGWSEEERRRQEQCAQQELEARRFG